MNKYLSRLCSLLWHPKITSFTGILFQIQGAKPTKKLWDATKEEAIIYIDKHGGFPTSFAMPCGSKIEFKEANALRVLDTKDIPCPCGDKTHWLVRFINYV